MYLNGEVNLKMENTSDLEQSVENSLVHDALLVGILVGKSNRKLKKSLNRLTDLADIYKNGQVGAFSLQGINRNNEMIQGYLYCGNEEWKASTFPMPKAIINRISLNHDWERFFRKIVGSRMINNFTFSKWEMYEWLSGNPKLSSYLPVTRYLYCPQDILEFLEKYNSGYIKPISGSYGKGIIKVSKQEESYQVEVNSKENRLFYLNREELKVYFQSLCKKRKFIIQQMIDLYVGERPIDFRLIIVKDGSGEWQDLGLLARKGKKEGIVSNIGLVKNGNSALQNLLSLTRHEAIKFRKRITEISIEAAKEMEKYGGVDGNLGNIGMDIAIDRNRNLWIIEINHRNPRHRMAVDAGEDGIYYKANQFLIDHAHNLAQLSKHDGK
jgi:glutathione synthase/RimK-type ligase-like ATP-grasp enzyme